jgi:hypothetical protein
MCILANSFDATLCYSRKRIEMASKPLTSMNERGLVGAKSRGISQNTQKSKGLQVAGLRLLFEPEPIAVAIPATRPGNCFAFPPFGGKQLGRLVTNRTLSYHGHYSCEWESDHSLD